MTETQVVETGIIHLIGQAGLVVKFVMLCLLSASVFSWAVMFTKWKLIRSVAEENTRFLDVFWHSKNLEEISAKTEKLTFSPIASVFRSGFRELKKLSQAERSEAGALEVDNINRALFRAANSEIAQIEKHIGWLATIASATPFVGLFGTVWGIMSSFQNIGATGSANLAVVAPGIAEALIATAAGLAAAIPAVVAYNHFVNHMKRIAIDVDCFSQDFLNIVQRSLMGGRKK